MKKISAIAAIITVSAMLGAGAISASPMVKFKKQNSVMVTDTLPGDIKKPRPGQVNPLPPQVTPNPVPYPNTVPTPLPGVTPNNVTPGVTPTPMPGVNPNPVTPGVTPVPAPMPVTPNPVSPGVTPTATPGGTPRP
ncbi:hypothetical protein ACFQZS_09975 [Mucilaginibacter calamicampi]|uniref:Uncharacterized protein n=1 Tax=Mucilaginibacter calamicampi TaxID=1302352 RepID=A0ABW2Z194_9SPHI